MFALHRSFPQLFTKHVGCLSKMLCVSSMPPPLMGNELLEHIQPTDNCVVLDMTFGSGGHTELILKSDPTVTVLALDRDPTSHAVAHSIADKYPGRVIPLLGKFSDLPGLIEPLGYRKEAIDVMLFHCGSSTFQMESADRGFSYLLDGPLDMRMDGTVCKTGVRAYDVLQYANEIDLKNIFKMYGCLTQGKKIARAILYIRHTSATLKSTTDLKELLVSQCELSNQEVRSAFRSLRYFVNDELNEINHGLLLAAWYLKKGGRLVTISEAYLDDLIIKNHVLGHEPASFFGPLPMEHVGFTAPLESNDIVKTSCWTKINKHVIIPEGDRLMMKTSKLRALLKT